MVDKSQLDTTFVAFAENMLLLTHNEIVAEVPQARWLQNETTLAATVAGTQYVAVPSDFDIDSLVSIRDEVTNKRLRKISPEIADTIDPGRDITGDEILWWYQKVGTNERIYFLNRPDSVDTLTIIFGTNPSDPATNGNFMLPAKYEPYLISGALVKVWGRVDAGYNANHLEKHFERGLAVIRKDANSDAGEETGMSNHRPTKQDAGVQGASFPSNFDISD
jgi:hypothetical protein